MNKKRILILEDEFITQSALSGILKDRGYAISGLAMHAHDAIKILEKEETDLAILDINIKGEKDGIWVAQQIQEKFNIPYIYLTAYKDENTLQKAIDTAPAGYLVKPFDDSDVYASIEVAFKTHTKVARLKEASERNKKGVKHIFIKTDHLHKRLNLEEIIYIQSSRNYVELYLENGKQLLRKTLKDFLPELPSHFIQIHRSYAVNILKMDSFSSGFVRLGNQEIPMSEKYKEAFMQEVKLL